MSVDLEKILRPVDNAAPAFEPKYMTLASGDDLVIRQVGQDEIPDILPYIDPLRNVERDFYDIVAARLYAELLGYYKNRVQDEYVLVAQINGELAAVVNGWRLSPEVGVSYHTMALRRGLRVGAHAFAAKMEYHMDTLKQETVLIVAESPIGFRRWMIEYGLQKRDGQHELGGATSYKLTRQLYFNSKSRLVAGERPVPEDLLNFAHENLLVADEETIQEKICGTIGGQR